MTRKIFTALLILVLTAGCSFADVDLGEGYHRPEGFSEVYITNSDGTAIQNAVDNIQEGGTITLAGTFKLKEGINIKKSITIIGENTAVLDLTEGRGRVFRCEGNEITLENLVIMGGKETNGGGVKIDAKTKTMTITSLSLIHITAIIGGGGIHSDAQHLIMTNCNITNNNVPISGGGGMSLLGGNVEMENCTFTGNTSAYLGGGGIGVVGATLNLKDCKITGNAAKFENGGGIAITLGSKVTATNCDISGNTSKNADTYNIYCDSTSTFTKN